MFKYLFKMSITFCIINEIKCYVNKIMALSSGEEPLETGAFADRAAGTEKRIVL